MDWLDLLAVQGTLRSLFQHHSSKASILQHLLTDLKKVNASMKPMGALQPGIPSPTTIPHNWHIWNILEKFHFAQQNELYTLI